MGIWLLGYWDTRQLRAMDEWRERIADINHINTFKIFSTVHVAARVMLMRVYF